MKKIFTLAAVAAVALSFSLTSCTKSAEDYVAKQKELTEQIAKEEDATKKEELQKELDELNTEVDNKCKEDKEFAEAYAKALVAEVAAEVAE